MGLANTVRAARRRLRTFYEHCDQTGVRECRRLARTIRAWEDEVLAFHTTGRSNGPTEGINLLIKKVKRVIAKADPTAPHEILLVIDANTGQNAVAQVKAFDDALGLTGLVVTKLDGTAKGGVIVGIQEELGVPVKYIGVGEEIEDLQPFDAAGFVKALFES